MNKFLCTLSFVSYCILCAAQKQEINKPDVILVLPATNAVFTNGIKKHPLQTARETKVFAVQGWNNEEQTLTWEINLKEKGNYKIAVLIEIKGLSPNASADIQLSASNQKIVLHQANTSWNKLFFPEFLKLEPGNNHLQLSLKNIQTVEHPELSIYSIEVATERAWKRNDAAAESLRSKPEWLDRADYGLFFHWNARSKPKSGDAKSYADAVLDFDVVKFASMVHETGAKFIVLTTSWGGFTFPAPLKTVESIVPGSTTPRDLITDMSDALSKLNIRLLVYCNFRLDRMGVQKDDGVTPQKLDTAFDKLISIYSEISHRYKNKLAGFWIDDGMAMYPYNAPFERLTMAMKEYNKKNVVCYNSWIYTRFTDFQDFFGGEFGINIKAARGNDKNLPVGGNGYFVGGGQKGLKATFCGQLEKDDWTHTQLNKEISPPILKADELINIIKEGMLRKNVAIMNVSIYQDGTISPQTFELLKELNKTINK
jgi:hypothetical protein